MINDQPGGKGCPGPTTCPILRIRRLQVRILPSAQQAEGPQEKSRGPSAFQDRAPSTHSNRISRSRLDGDASGRRRKPGEAQRSASRTSRIVGRAPGAGRREPGTGNRTEHGVDQLARCSHRPTLATRDGSPLLGAGCVVRVHSRERLFRSRLWLRPRSCLRPRSALPPPTRARCAGPRGMRREPGSRLHDDASGEGAQTPGWEGRRSRAPAGAGRASRGLPSRPPSTDTNRGERNRSVLNFSAWASWSWST